MLSDTDFRHHMQRLGLPAEAQDIVATIRTSPPSRAVTGRAGNVCVRYPSRKMGVTIQAESHRVELVAIYLMEHDLEVLEYYDQPPPLTLTYVSPTERKVTVHHTPDFFVLRTDGIVWEEWKRRCKNLYGKTATGLKSGQNLSPLAPALAPEHSSRNDPSATRYGHVSQRVSHCTGKLMLEKRPDRGKSSYQKLRHPRVNARKPGGAYAQISACCRRLHNGIHHRIGNLLPFLHGGFYTPYYTRTWRKQDTV